MYRDIYKLLTFWLLYELNKSDLLQGVEVLMSQNLNRGGPFQVSKLEQTTEFAFYFGQLVLVSSSGFVVPNMLLACN